MTPIRPPANSNLFFVTIPTHRPMLHRPRPSFEPCLCRYSTPTSLLPLPPLLPPPFCRVLRKPLLPPSSITTLPTFGEHGCVPVCSTAWAAWSLMVWGGGCPTKKSRLKKPCAISNVTAPGSCCWHGCPSSATPCLWRPVGCA